jgi:nicotinate-nucleotide pyrophosphorylase (carboxylating)
VQIHIFVNSFFILQQLPMENNSSIKQSKPDDPKGSYTIDSINGASLDFSLVIPQAQMDAAIQQWLQEDHPSWEIGGLVVGCERKSAQLFLKSSGILAGKPFFESVFRQLDCQVLWEPHAEEGTAWEKLQSDVIEDDNSDKASRKIKYRNKVCLAVVEGPVHCILRGERTALNILSRCSGVATATRDARTYLGDWNGWLAGTRKTTPGAFGKVEKYGLLVGGASTHRLDLSQMVMLKDNHIWSHGSISQAVKIARRAAGFSQKIEVECQSLEDALEAAAAGADIVMLDNFPPEQLKRDAKTFKERFPHVLVEASGGITNETISQYLSEHVDIVSQGKLTQGYNCLDFSLKISH